MYLYRNKYLNKSCDNFRMNVIVTRHGSLLRHPYASPFHAPIRCCVVLCHGKPRRRTNSRAQSRTFVNRARHQFHVPVPPSSGQCRHDVVKLLSSSVLYKMALVEWCCFKNFIVCFYFLHIVYFFFYFSGVL